MSPLARFSTMKLTVAIPTYNRAESLRQTLLSVNTLRFAGDLECLIIDNDSSDHTAAVVAASKADFRFPLSRIVESRRGSSFARNRAISEARGEFIFFIDDDVTATADWAQQLSTEIQSRQLDGACGMVLPVWPCEPPAWLGADVLVKLAVHDPAAGAQRQWEQLSNYFSANVGFRKSSLERFGGFREDLGVVGGNPFSGEDTELFERIISGGGSMGFAPKAVVYHRIEKARISRAYLRRKSFAYGMGSAVKGGAHHNGLDKLVRNLVRMASARLRGDAARAFYHQLECANFFGYWAGRLRRS